MVSPFNSIELLERIGVGGMAEVYKARMVGEGGFSKVVAVKRPLPQHLNNSEICLLLMKEAQLAAKLHHSNIAQVYFAGEVHGTLSIVMELISGISLKTLMENCHQSRTLIPLEVAIEIVESIAKGIQYAHSFFDQETQSRVRIIHRDLSPHNIMLDTTGQVKILDFGIAKVLHESQDATNTSSLNGKVGYLSPEIVSGGQVNEGADLYAIGVILYELLSGNRLYGNGSIYETVEKIKKSEFEDLSKVRPSLPLGVIALVGSLLDKDAEKRPNSAAEICERLRGLRAKIGSEGDCLGAFLSSVSSREKSYPDVTQTDVSEGKPKKIFSGPKLMVSKFHRWAITSSLLGGLLVTVVATRDFHSIGRGANRSVASLDGPLRLVWNFQGEEIDISAPKLEYEPWAGLGKSELSEPGCAVFCNGLADPVEFFFGMKAATEGHNDKINWGKEISKFIGNFERKGADFGKAFKLCSFSTTCLYAARGLDSIVATAADKIVDADDTLEKVQSKVLKNRGTRFTIQDQAGLVASYLEKAYGAGSEELGYLRSRKHVKSSEVFGFDIVHIPGIKKVWNDNVCRSFGDLLYGQFLVDGFDPDTKKMKLDLTFIASPLDAKMQVVGTRANTAIVDFRGIRPENATNESTAFTLGFCVYKRDENGLKYARHWVPKIGKAGAY